MRAHFYQTPRIIVILLFLQSSRLGTLLPWYLLGKVLVICTLFDTYPTKCKDNHGIISKSKDNKGTAMQMFRTAMFLKIGETSTGD